MATLDAEQFYKRLEHIQRTWLGQKSTLWSKANFINVVFGSTNDNIYSKSAAFHLYLFGYEDFTDSIIVITKGNFYFFSSAKKCNVLKAQVEGKQPNGASEPFALHFIEKSKDESVNIDNFAKMINTLRKSGCKNAGLVLKEKPEGNFCTKWLETVDDNQIEKVDITQALGTMLCVKDESELDACKRAAVLSNKVMKHGFIEEMESIIDEDKKVSHQDLAKKIESIIQDPSKIKLNVAADTVDSCYEPIIQSGGKYDIRINATSNNDILTPNIIICSLGARYKNYCATIARTFLVDAPPKVEKHYKLLLACFLSCLEKMVKNGEMKDVYEKGMKGFLKEKDAEGLLAHVPKTLGFAMGLEFRDSSMLLNSNNTTKFVPGMVFSLTVGFSNVPLTAEDLAKSPEAVKNKLSSSSTFSLLLSDMVVIQEEGVAEILTKVSKEFSSISYSIAGDDEDEGDDEEEGDDDGEDGEDGKDGKKKSSKKGGKGDDDADDGGVRRSTRNREEKAMNEAMASNRVLKQKEIFRKFVSEAKKRLEETGTLHPEKTEEEEKVIAKDLEVYRSAQELPRELNPHRLKIDTDKEAILIPISGRLIPFHISTIKQMTYTEPDIRIHFYSSGGTLNKDVNKNMRALIEKYGKEYAFIKEVTYRTVAADNNPSNKNHFATVYSQYQELRKKIRQREQKAEQEKGLVNQDKLIRIKDARIPRLVEVTMRPAISGRKCVGTIEAHQNGIRFTSHRAEVLDLMYANIKHAIYQPCDKTTMVLIHFHLKDAIMINKKKQKDVQVYTEVVEASLNLDAAKRYGFDPDEIEEEQREREMKKRLNIAFKEFCSKLEKLAAHYSFPLAFDAPYKKSGFLGTWSKEMVLLQPTANCLVNLTEWPPLVMTLQDIEHVHFERVTFAAKAFDLTFIFKDWNIPPRTINAIDVKYLDIIQDWLNEIEMTYTKGTRNFNWNEIMAQARERGNAFYDSHDEDGSKLPVGWQFISADADDDEEEDAEEEMESDYSGSEQESEDGSDDEDDSELEEEDSEEDDDDSDDYDEEDDLSEKGQDWDELEREAAAKDKKRDRDQDSDDGDRRPAKKGKSGGKK